MTSDARVSGGGRPPSQHPRRIAQVREQEAAVEEIGRRLARQRRDGDVVNGVCDPGRRRRARPRHVLRRGVDTEVAAGATTACSRRVECPGPHPRSIARRGPGWRTSARGAPSWARTSPRAAPVDRRPPPCRRTCTDRASRSATGSVVSSAVCWLMARRGARPATASLFESHSRRGAALGRLLSLVRCDCEGRGARERRGQSLRYQRQYDAAVAV